MNKLFFALLVSLLLGCGGSNRSSGNMYGSYRARVFVGENLVDSYNCYRYTRTDNNYKLWTDKGIVELSGNVIIERVD